MGIANKVIQMREPAGLTVRKPEFDITPNLKRHYFRDSALLTHILNSLHIIVPAGERFFIRSVKAYMNEVPEGELKNRLRPFIQQEVQHFKHHDDFHNTLRKHGLAVDWMANTYEKVGFGFLEKLANRVFGPIAGLSGTAAAEHLTAILAELTFLYPNMTEGMDEEMARLMKWHAAEEIEHKSVVYDLLQEVNPSYLRRIAGMVVITGGLWGFLALGTVVFSFTDDQFKLRDLPRELGKLWKFLRGGDERKGEGMRHLLKEYLQYYRKSFHPDDNDNMHLAHDYLATMEI